MDQAGQCPLVHAALHGQLDATSFILQCDWSAAKDKRPTRNEALQQALVSAAGSGHKEVSMCQIMWIKMTIYIFTRHIGIDVDCTRSKFIIHKMRWFKAFPLIIQLGV